MTVNALEVRHGICPAPATINGTNLNQVDVDWSAADPGDHIRVPTLRSPLADIPEPGSLLLLGSGLVAASCLLRRRKART